VSLTARDDSPETAALIANEFANVLPQFWNPVTLNQEVVELVAAARRCGAARGGLDRLAGCPGLRSTIASAQRQVQVIQPAVPSRRPLLYAAIALAIAILVAAALLAARPRRSQVLA
jgi:hypothetical protein